MGDGTRSDEVDELAAVNLEEFVLVMSSNGHYTLWSCGINC
jgi:hypothetical protein